MFVNIGLQMSLYYNGQKRHKLEEDALQGATSLNFSLHLEKKTKKNCHASKLSATLM